MDLALHDRTAVTAGRLDGRIAIVTGSTSGIGLGIARALAGAGASVVINGFGDPDAVRATLGELTALGAPAVYSAADLSTPAPIADLIATALDAFGRIDILVN